MFLYSRQIENIANIDIHYLFNHLIIIKWHVQKWTNFNNNSALENQLHPATLQASSVNGRAAPFQA